MAAGSGCRLWVRRPWLLLAAGAAHSERARPRTTSCRPSKAYRYTTRVEGDRLDRRLGHRAGLLPLQEKDGRRLRHRRTAQLGEPQWPKGEDHTDEYFGTQEIYRGKVEVPVPFVHRRCAAREARARAAATRLRGRRPVLPAAEMEDRGHSCPLLARAGGGLSSLLGKKSAAAGNQDDFLPPDAGVPLRRRPAAGRLRPAHLGDRGRLLPLQRHASPSRARRRTCSSASRVLPKGKPKHDEYFGDTEVYYEVLEATLPVARAASSEAQPLKLKVTYQGCAEGGLCYNPITKEATIELPPTTTATSLPASRRADAVVRQRRGQGRGAGSPGCMRCRATTCRMRCSLFFGAGLLLSLTPCVLPMIPILSGIIVGQGANVTRTRSFALALTYVQGMALTYAAAGAIFVLAFRQAPQAFFQSVRGSSRSWCCCSSRSRWRCSACTRCRCRARCRRG